MPLNKRNKPILLRMFRSRNKEKPERARDGEYGRYCLLNVSLKPAYQRSIKKCYWLVYISSIDYISCSVTGIRLHINFEVLASVFIDETWVQSQVESYQRLKKWYLMPPCLTLSIIRYGSRVKWSNPGKGVAPSPTPWCSKLSKREPSGHPRLWSPTYVSYPNPYSPVEWDCKIHRRHRYRKVAHPSCKQVSWIWHQTIW